jgi:hypothetical protein
MLPPPFLEQFQQISLIYFHTYIHNTLTIFILLHPLCLPSPLLLILNPHTEPVKYVIPSFFKVHIDCSMEFHRGVSRIYTSYCNQINSLYYLLLLHHPALPLFNSFQCILLCYLHTQLQCGSLLFTLYHCLLIRK